MHSFHAYIDEAGDEGFTFKEPPERASSEWFVISAIMVRAKDKPAISRRLKETLDPIEQGRKSPMHFRSLPHEIRVPVAHKLSTLPILIINVSFNKKQLGQHTLGNSRRLYFYCTRFLLERISWASTHYYRAGQGDGRCKLTFSHCKNLSYSALSEYLGLLRGQRTQIRWDHLDSANIDVLAHKESIWLRAADASASSVFRGLELTEHGFCEDRYGRMLKPVIYKRGNNYFSYGLKFFPTVPEIEKGRDNRYGWLDLFR